MKTTTILIPTFNRFEALVATLTSLSSQSNLDFDVIVANQGDPTPFLESVTLLTLKRIFSIHAITLAIYHRPQRHGMAEQRQFLLSCGKTPFVFYLDDDVILEPWVMELLTESLQKQACGFVGMPVVGLSYVNDVRPDEQQIEFIDTVEPEQVLPNSPEWKRYRVHNAANPYHVARRYGVTPEKPRIYKVAWVGGAVMYDRKKLLTAGGFDFGDVPTEHAGEDVAAQLRVMKRFGGCGVLPSGAYHQEAPTTILNREFDIPQRIFG